MGSRVTVEKYDDMDNSVAATQTVKFAFGDQAYEIDLGDENANLLMDFLGPYIENSRHLGTLNVTRRRRRSADPEPEVETGTDVEPKVDMNDLRQWALDAGVEIKPRGRVKQEVMDQYLQAVKDGYTPASAAPSGEDTA
jgi:hypothetical protein